MEVEIPHPQCELFALPQPEEYRQLDRDVPPRLDEWLAALFRHARQEVQHLRRSEEVHLLSLDVRRLHPGGGIYHKVVPLDSVLEHLLQHN